MNQCTICSAENAPDAKFCNACGSNLEGPSKEITVVATQPLVNRYVIKDRFKIIKRLGKGGMGEVLLAEDERLRRKVAIKSILKSSLSDTSSKVRFLREAQTASQLDHTNICTIYEIYEEDEKDFIVMQYVDGITLDQLVIDKKLSIEKILDISIQVCDGMIEAHAKDIIHRDIKPGNIMIDNKGVVKILDFGLAKFTEDAAIHKGGMRDSDLTQKGFVMGTVAYISPEQAKGKTLDKRTDLFSFGVVLYEMIEGTNPFRVEEQIETLYNVLNKEVTFTRDIPDELKDIVKKTLEKDRENRYKDFVTLKEELVNFKDFYTRYKARKAEARVTEVIDVQEQVKILEEAHKTSDKENLGEMVDRIRKMKASTERVEPTRKRKITLLWGLPILVLAIIIAAFLVWKTKEKPLAPIPGQEERFYIYLHPLENETGENGLSEILDYLLTESLNQFEEFKIIDKKTAVAMARSGSKNTPQPGQTTASKKGTTDPELNLEALEKSFHIEIKYEFEGRIKKIRDTYTIEADLKPTAAGQNPANLTASGLKKDSFLETQVDMIAEGVYRQIFPRKAAKLEMKSCNKTYGNRWDTFADFYAGLLLVNKIEYGKAEKMINKSPDLLISKYYLSQVYYFLGKREKALEFIDQLIPVIDKLAPALQARVKAMEGRLKFKFTEEIKHLEELKDEYPFSRTVLFELGEAYFHHANPLKAMEYYKKVLEIDPDDSNALNHLGYCYSYIGDHIDALACLEKYKMLDGTSNSFDSLGDGYFFSGQLEYAESMKKSAVGQADDPISYPYQTLADIYILKARYDQAKEALDNYRRLENSKTADAYALARQAFIYYLDRQYPRALEFVDRSLQTYDSTEITDNTSPEVHWIKGLILLESNKVEESREELEKLKKLCQTYNLDKDNFKAAYKYYIHLDALVLEKEKKIKEAEEKFRFLLSMKNSLSYWITYYNYQFFHIEYAKFLNRDQRTEEALAEVEKCLEFNDRYLPGLWLKAELLEKSGKTGEAKLVYEKIAEGCGESSEKNYYRGLLKEKLHQLQSK